MDTIKEAADAGLVNYALAAFCHCVEAYKADGRLPKGDEVPAGVWERYGLSISEEAGRRGLTNARRHLRDKKRAIV